MESFYGGRKGASFIIVERFDGIDIPQVEGHKVYRGDYYAIDADTKELVVQNGKLVIRNADNQNNPDWAWKYYKHDGSAAAGTNLKFPIEEARGMKQCFEKGGETASQVNYGEYVIIDTIVGLHDYRNVDNGKVFRRGMDYQDLETAGAEYIGQILGPRGDVPIVDMALESEVKKHEGAKSGSLDLSNGGLVSGRDVDKITYSWVELEDPLGDTEGVLIGFTFPHLVIDFVATSVSPYYHREEDPEEEGQFINVDLVARVVNNDNKNPFYEQWNISVPKGIHGQDISLEQVTGADGQKDLKVTTVNYDRVGEGDIDVKTYDYHMTTNVELLADGRFKTTYNNGKFVETDLRIKDLIKVGATEPKLLFNGGYWFVTTKNDSVE